MAIKGTPSHLPNIGFATPKHIIPLIGGVGMCAEYDLDKLAVRSEIACCFGSEGLMLRKIGKILLVAAVMGVGSVADGTAQPVKQLRVTIPVIGMNFLPLFVAVDKGLFAKEGFDVEITSTSGDGPDVDALIAGSVQFTISTPNRLLTSFEQGKPLLAIMNMANRNAIDCVINKDAAAKVGITESTPLDQRLKALKGLKVAGTRPGAFTYLVLVDYARRAGLVPQQDLQILGVGGGPSMIAALENGAIDVACNTSPTTDLMVKRGKAVMFTYNSVGKDPAYDDFLFELLYVRPDYAKQNPEIVRAFCRALLAAIADIRDTPARDQLPLLQKRFPGVEDDMLIQVLETLKPIFRRDGKVTPTALDKAIKFMLDTGAIKTGAPWNQIATYDFLPK
jgi:NitT/TauT family transport system substrate-binding protein